MKQAERLLSLTQKHFPVQEKKKNEGSMNDLGQMEKDAMKIVEKLKNESFSKDNDSQIEFSNQMKKLAESDAEISNRFMEYMDNAASDYKDDMLEAAKKSESDDSDADDKEKSKGDKSVEEEDDMADGEKDGKKDDKKDDEEDKAKDSSEYKKKK